jgi:hypothetical protein
MKLVPGFRLHRPACEAQEAARLPGRGDAEPGPASRLIEVVVDRELDGPGQRPERKAPPRVVGGHLELGLGLVAEEGTLLDDARPFPKRPVGTRADHTPLPLGQLLDVGQVREDVFHGARDLDRELGPKHRARVPLVRRGPVAQLVEQRTFRNTGEPMVPP